MAPTWRQHIFITVLQFRSQGDPDPWGRPRGWDSGSGKPWDAYRMRAGKIKGGNVVRPRGGASYRVVGTQRGANALGTQRMALALGFTNRCDRHRIPLRERTCHSDLIAIAHAQPIQRVQLQAPALVRLCDHRAATTSRDHVMPWRHSVPLAKFICASAAAHTPDSPSAVVTAFAQRLASLSVES